MYHVNIVHSLYTWQNSLLSEPLSKTMSGHDLFALWSKVHRKSHFKEFYLEVGLPVRFTPEHKRVMI